MSGIVLFSNNACNPNFITHAGIPPPAPTEFNFTGITSTTATVSWKSPRDGLECKLRWKKAARGVPVSSITLPSDRTSYTIENTDPGTTYKLMLNSINTENNKESSKVFITVRTLVAGN